jgi:hypothetical protein
MARSGATHRTAAPSCPPATRDRTGRLHCDVHGRPAACRNPGLLDDSGLASASRPRIARGPQAPAGSPAIPEPGPRARRHPGAPAGLPFTPCAVTLDQLHRQRDGPCAAGTTDGDASAPRQSRKTLSAADPDVARSSGFNERVRDMPSPACTRHSDSVHLASAGQGNGGARRLSLDGTEPGRAGHQYYLLTANSKHSLTNATRRGNVRLLA